MSWWSKWRGYHASIANSMQKTWARSKPCKQGQTQRRREEVRQAWIVRLLLNVRLHQVVSFETNSSHPIKYLKESYSSHLHYIINLLSSITLFFLFGSFLTSSQHLIFNIKLIKLPTGIFVHSPVVFHSWLKKWICSSCYPIKCLSIWASWLHAHSSFFYYYHS